MMPDLSAPDWCALFAALAVNTQTARPLPSPMGSHYFYCADDTPRLLLAFPQRADDARWAAELIGALRPTAPCLQWQGSPVYCSGVQAAVVATSGDGEQILAAAPSHCETLGITLAQLHLAARDVDRARANPRGPLWWRECVAQLTPGLPADAIAILREELRVQALHRFTDLPRGLVLGAPVRANVWCHDGALRFVSLDRACTDLLLFDVALAVEDWCTTDEGRLDIARAQALLIGYAAIRPFTALERGAWPILLRAAALHNALCELRLGEPVDAVLARLSRRAKAEGEARRTWPAPAPRSACA